MPKLYTLPQAAERLGDNPASLRQYARRGTLHATKVGRDWLVTDQEIARFKRERRPKGRPMKEKK